ncbi:MAG: PQQ-dependent sugar dehydrogenase [Anaerolineae bacterium]|nr:PQQ-dependent sugar dehydrogenase [Anaerolineae bacterium]
MMTATRPLTRTVFILCLIAVFATVLTPSPAAGYQQGSAEAWKKEWGVPPGFLLSIDTDGYEFPSAIAFIPNPGDGPKDPLYFVTELRGQVKIITNDRSVYVFAKDYFRQDVERGVEQWQDEFGVAGICLAPEQGYVFVTFTYTGSDNKQRNNIIRFETTPITFNGAPSAHKEFREIFFEYKIDASHQIGGCQVKDGHLYVSVGDGLNAAVPPIDTNSLLGKILRFTLDVEPAPENPLYDAEQPLQAANYVWAYGFRNPFGLKFVGDRLFVAENGRGLDRFLEVHEGEDYLWDGEDMSLASRADVVFGPAIGPVQLDFYTGESRLFPQEFDNTFFMAMSAPKSAGIMSVPYDLENSRVSKVPYIIVRYLGEAAHPYSGVVVGLAIGPDGMYFSPLFPNGYESGAIYKLTYDPANEHPYRVDDLDNPAALINDKGCLGCHSVGGYGGNVAPSLDRDPLVKSLKERLFTEQYLASLDQIDSVKEEPYLSYSQARQEVRQAEGNDRILVWMQYHIQEPKFDNPQSQMPNLGLTSNQARLITEYLLSRPSNPSAGTEDSQPESSGGILSRLPEPQYWHWLPVFVAGSLFTFFGQMILKRRKRASAKTEKAKSG